MKRALWLLIFLPVMALASANKTVEYHLQNGMRVIVREDHRAPVVISSIWYRVGGSYEHDGITGISHMLEHMMFKGTPTYGPDALLKLVTIKGGQQNAMTSDDFTAYYQMWTKNNLPLSFKIESDRMRNLLFNQKLYDKEHQVVMEERRMRVDDNPQAIARERLNAAAFVNNPYHHPVIGWMTDVKHLTLTNLKQWYHDWYAPNNATLVVVGDVKAYGVYLLAKKYFGPLKSATLPTVKPRVEVANIGRRNIDLNIPAKLPFVIAAFRVPELKTVSKDNQWQPYALDMLANILSAGSSSRLQKDLVRNQQIAVSASAYYDPFRLHDGLFVFSGIPTVKHTTRDIQSAIYAEIKQLQEQPVSKAELDRVKAQVIASNVFQKDSLMYQMYDIGIPESVNLSWKLTRDYVNEVSKITPQQIQAVAKMYLIPDNLTVATVNPKKMTTGGAQHG